MSFKRDGNDSNLLTSLRKRRIGELLGESIPEEEAKLLSNGRFTCTVCNSVPIFDNVNMLVVHRQGKKHLANLKIHESKQRELMQLKAKRDHHQFLKKGTTFLPMALSSTSGILKSTPYDSRVEKAKVHPTERKQRINLPENFNGQASVQSLQPKASEKGTANSLRLQKLKQLQGSGWKKDWDGKWIKDENAEFDSDEEPPDIF
ncbi:hypothetical protein RRG08_032598 [Elysia crispata]|uniref:Sodium channel modifier 1 n=1 Tax=Elysia crispata TaxID=231223 RepID=A0AAE1CPY3_9GAST|nr:hypothetical protein RRG08_032598 [Elysia crispata]